MRHVKLAVLLISAVTAAHASELYTFENTGANPYSFSFFESTFLTTPGIFSIPSFTVGGNTYTKAALGISGGGGYCFSFASAIGSATPCSVSAGSSSGAGFVSLFPAANAPGTYNASIANPVGVATAAPDQLIIAVIPEPSTWLPAATSIALLALFAARRKRSISLLPSTNDSPRTAGDGRCYPLGRGSRSGY